MVLLSAVVLLLSLQLLTVVVPLLASFLFLRMVVLSVVFPLLSLLLMTLVVLTLASFRPLRMVVALTVTVLVTTMAAEGTSEISTNAEDHPNEFIFPMVVLVMSESPTKVGIHPEEEGATGM